VTSPDPGDGGRRDELVGTLEVLGAAGLWGTSGIFSVLLFRGGVGAAEVALFRPLVATGFLVAWALVRDRRAFRPGISGLAVLWGVGGGVTAVFQLSYQMATEALGVPATVGMLYLAPLLVMLIAGPLLGERPARRQVVWGAVAVAGVWVVVLGARGAEVTLTGAGIGWGLATGASYAGYTLFGRWGGRRWPPLTTVLHSYLAASLILALVLPTAWGPLVWPVAPTSRLLLLAHGFFTIALAVMLFYDALRRIPAARASVTATVEPVVAAILAAAILGQHLTPSGWLGLALVVVGVAGASRLRRRATPA
jgi:drug/metabolite transporter (DMT)-like permease